MLLCLSLLRPTSCAGRSCHEQGVGYQFQQQLRKLSHFHLNEGSHSHHGSSHRTTPRPRLSRTARPQGVNAPLKKPLYSQPDVFPRRQICSVSLSSVTVWWWSVLHSSALFVPDLLSCSLITCFSGVSLFLYVLICLWMNMLDMTYMLSQFYLYSPILYRTLNREKLLKTKGGGKGRILRQATGGM